MGGPTRMRNSYGALKSAGLLNQFLQLAHATNALGDLHLAIQNSHASGVIAAVLKALQALN